MAPLLPSATSSAITYAVPNHQSVPITTAAVASANQDNLIPSNTFSADVTASASDDETEQSKTKMEVESSGFVINAAEPFREDSKKYSISVSCPSLTLNELSPELIQRMTDLQQAHEPVDTNLTIDVREESSKEAEESAIDLNNARTPATISPLTVPVTPVTTFQKFPPVFPRTPHSYEQGGLTARLTKAFAHLQEENTPDGDTLSFAAAGAGASI